MRVLFAGGGTGGHIYPALALARYLQEADGAEVIFAGTERGMEKEIIPAAGFGLELVPVVGLERRLSLQTGRALFLAASGVMTARRMIKKFRPDIVVGTGGYVAGPVVLAAVLARIPTVIHEQNAIPGFTNVVLSRMANRVCLSFSDSARYFPRPQKTVLTGNPRASEAALAANEPELPGKLIADVPLLLCVGGSHGAARLNEAFAGSVAHVLSACDAQIVYVTGKRYFADINREMEPLFSRFPRRLQVLPYHPDLPALLNRADLVVSRAGATTLAEITALGVPAVLVPSPNVTKNHQEYNARALFDHGAAVLLRENDLSTDGLAKLLAGLLSD
ncbi:MAG: undecaprenyldiphospho-muramoylpentapeptide beta-N-acetylglucosaminyltransferase, partial [Bacillota bacterium]|nr:undecaprenyldiphospho-muramoylpentapeptide beta-N-acetylglucosaminyltransferase [Bacillota bacterium]